VRKCAIRDGPFPAPLCGRWGLVGVLYLLLNTSVLVHDAVAGVDRPGWHERAALSGGRWWCSGAYERGSRTRGCRAGGVDCVCFGVCPAAGLLRVPYAAALDDNYFRIFARVHARHRIPNVSLLMLAGVSMVFCVLQLGDLVAALVVIRIPVAVFAATGRSHGVTPYPTGDGKAIPDMVLPAATADRDAGFLYILFSPAAHLHERYFSPWWWC